MSTPASDVSAVRRRDVVDALRRGTVPQAGLGLFAVGLERFEATLDDDLATAHEGVPRSTPCGASTAPARPSSPVGSPNVPSGAGSR